MDKLQQFMNEHATWADVAFGNDLIELKSEIIDRLSKVPIKDEEIKSDE